MTADAAGRVGAGVATSGALGGAVGADVCITLGVGAAVWTVTRPAVAVATGAATTAGAAVGLGSRVGESVATGDGAGDAEGAELGGPMRDGDADGRGVRGGRIVAMATGGRCGAYEGAGVLVTTTTGSDARPPRCMNTATSAPIPKPATTTPRPIASVGNQPPPSPPDFEERASGRRRRRGGVDIAARVQRGRQEASHAGAKRPPMIRVSVPIDLTAVVANASAAFALATPLRLADIVATAVVVALGERAPQDKRERAVRKTLDGLHAGEFEVEIDGRLYREAHEVVVCTGVIALRFFARRTYRRAA
jgi:hypothetical protein